MRVSRGSGFFELASARNCRIGADSTRVSLSQADAFRSSPPQGDLSGCGTTRPAAPRHHFGGLTLRRHSRDRRRHPLRLSSGCDRPARQPWSAARSVQTSGSGGVLPGNHTRARTGRTTPVGSPPTIRDPLRARRTGCDGRASGRARARVNRRSDRAALRGAPDARACTRPFLESHSRLSEAVHHLQPEGDPTPRCSTHRRRR